MFAGWAGTAAAQSFGFATFSAVVDADGTTARGSGVRNSARTATGSYIIIFTREVAACAFLAGPRGAKGGQVSVRETANPDRIRINTYSRAGQPANLAFVVLVNCAS